MIVEDFYKSMKFLPLFILDSEIEMIWLRAKGGDTDGEDRTSRTQCDHRQVRQAVVREATSADDCCRACQEVEVVLSWGAVGGGGLTTFTRIDTSLGFQAVR